MSTLSEVRWDLRTGGADVTGFPRQEWLACLQTVLRRANRVDLDCPPLGGTWELREELACYVGRVRGARTTPCQIMITAGFAPGLSLLCRMFRRLGIDVIGLEDPGHPGSRALVESSGLRAVPIPVDENGIDVAALARSEARAVLVTPAHQFPTGVVLVPHLRRVLLDWAERVNGFIIEDDYDGDFWYEAQERLPSLQGLAPDRVAYAGTASKTLAPCLRLGWLCLPSALMEELECSREPSDLGAGGIDQLAYAEFIRTGRLDRHLRRIRACYRDRYRTLITVLSDQLPDVRVSGSAAGGHAYLRLPAFVDEKSVVMGALRRRVLVDGGTRFRFERSKHDPALVVGYATQPKTALVDAIHALAKATRDVMARTHLLRIPSVQQHPAR